MTQDHCGICENFYIFLKNDDDDDDDDDETDGWNQGPFSISLLKLSQFKAMSWSQPSNLLQTEFLSCVQVSDLGEILTWDIAVNFKFYLNNHISSNNGRYILYQEYMIIPIQEGFFAIIYSS